ncbi:MAG: O-antigen ligase family protein, partial [Patescibacteria group bacterium]
MVACLVCVYAYSEWIKIDFGRESSTLGNPLILSAYLLVHIFLAFVLSISETKRKKQLRWIIGLFLFTILLTGSRSTLLGLGVSLIAALFLFRSACKSYVQRYVKRPHQYIFIVCALLFIFIVSGASSVFRTNLRDRFTLTTIAVEAALIKPIAGFGIGQFTVAFNHLFDPSKTNNTLREMWYEQAHNQYLDSLVATGIIGLFGYLFLWGSFLLTLRQNRTTHTEQQKNITRIFLLFTLAFFVEKLFYFDVFSEQILLFFLFASVPAWFHTSIDPIPSPDSNKKSYFTIVLFLLLFIPTSFLIYFVNVRPFLDALTILKAEDTLKRGEIAEANRLFHQSIDHFSPYQTDVILKMSEPVLDARWMFGIDSPEMIQLLADVQSVMATESEKHPFDPKLAMTHAYVTETWATDPATIRAAKVASERVQSLAPHRAEPFEL